MLTLDFASSRDAKDVRQAVAQIQQTKRQETYSKKYRPLTRIYLTAPLPHLLTDPSLPGSKPPLPLKRDYTSLGIEGISSPTYSRVGSGKPQEVPSV